ncbi:hypothetical protein L227DRAFT_224134 [Lentinus tigrinus ALCF2SS1-6]|uniref:Uncharacterized protein n=1 Tax=Lentinus tigrinus ALCF2SS1-6 TaxID=1328759 RepID=A0A5C2S810_9APHY|nr:hypothetical protein L227DRAFT_224134 [Lentinus tigrinus ALCF2SS1-6]
MSHLRTRGDGESSSPFHATPFPLALFLPGSPLSVLSAVYDSLATQCGFVLPHCPSVCMTNRAPKTAFSESGLKFARTASDGVGREYSTTHLPVFCVLRPYWMSRDQNGSIDRGCVLRPCFRTHCWMPSSENGTKKEPKNCREHRTRTLSAKL